MRVEFCRRPKPPQPPVTRRAVQGQPTPGPSCEVIVAAGVRRTMDDVFHAQVAYAREAGIPSAVLRRRRGRHSQPIASA